MIRHVIFCLLVLSCGLGQLVTAHQQKEGYSSILFNPRSGLIEVAHRFYLHDAEHAIKRGGVISSESVGNAAKADLANNQLMQAAFSQYIVDSFAVKTLNHAPEQLELVGYEVEGKYLWVYQQTQLQLDLTEIWVKMTALQAIWSGQTNHINVDINKNTYSIRLKHGDSWQKISLTQNKPN
jgi:hypothetical protein